MKNLFTAAFVILAIATPFSSYAKGKNIVLASKKPVTVTSPSVVVHLDGKQVIQLVNVERVKLGLAPLKENAKLARAAQGKSDDMNAKQYWAHASPAGMKGWSFIRKEGYVYEIAGENLAMGYTTYQAAVAGWMASPSHHANIVDNEFTETGVGITVGTYEGKPTVFIAQLFAKPYTN